MGNINIQSSIHLPRAIGSKGYELKFLDCYTDEEQALVALKTSHRLN
ncbi:MAG: hypothetical protein ACKVUS_06180 [Saprospiraceae bacterium]